MTTDQGEAEVDDRVLSSNSAATTAKKGITAKYTEPSHHR